MCLPGSSAITSGMQEHTFVAVPPVGKSKRTQAQGTVYVSAGAHDRWYEGHDDGGRSRRRGDGSLVPPEVDFEAKAQDVPPEFRWAAAVNR